MNKPSCNTSISNSCNRFGDLFIILVLFISTKGTILRDYQFKRLYSFLYNI